MIEEKQPTTWSRLMRLTAVIVLSLVTAAQARVTVFEALDSASGHPTSFAQCPQFFVNGNPPAVLVADALHKAEYYAALRRLPLPKPATWLEEGVRGKSTVLIDTIQRFKGLESPIVILWGLDTIDLSQRQELLYVGMSRAKSLLFIVGRAATCAAFKESPKQ